MTFNTWKVGASNINWNLAKWENNISVRWAESVHDIIENNKIVLSFQIIT